MCLPQATEAMPQGAMPQAAEAMPQGCRGCSRLLRQWRILSLPGLDALKRLTRARAARGSLGRPDADPTEMIGGNSDVLLCQPQAPKINLNNETNCKDLIACSFAVVNFPLYSGTRALAGKRKMCISMYVKGMVYIKNVG